MEHTLSGSSVVVATKDQLSCDLGGEAAILQLEHGLYYGLDAVGARIWDLIQVPRSVEAVRDTLLDEYEVDPERCERELLELLEQLAAKRLIEVRDGSAG